MNKTSNFTFVSIILLPALLLFFQNCSELIGQDSQMTSKSSINSIKLPPLLLTSSQTLGFSTQASCNKLTQNTLLYSKNSHLCFEATNDCELSLLKEKGFEAGEDSCSEAILDTNFNPDTLTAKTASDLGYELSEELICSQQYLQMINLESGICVEARDGCQISYLESLKYNFDELNLCAQIN